MLIELFGCSELEMIVNFGVYTDLCFKSNESGGSNLDSKLYRGRCIIGE